MFKKILIYFVSWKALAFLFVFLATFTWPLDLKFTVAKTFGQGFSYLFWSWANFDGYHYLTIAASGYGQNQHPFFPLFPLIINMLNSITRIPHLISALIVSNFLFLLSVFILIKLLVLDKKPNLTSLFLLILILFPTAFYYGAVYNDSLFLFLSALTIYSARKKSFFRAGIWGALATLTRLNGLALAFIIGFEYLAGKEDNLSQWNIKNIFKRIKTVLLPVNILKEKIYTILLIPLSFVSYLAYTHFRYGDWNLVFTSMSIWNQDKVTIPIQVFWRYFKMLIFAPKSHFSYYVAIGELFFVLFYIFLLIYSFKKIRLSYWLFFAVSILIPSLTGTFAGMPRYGLHIYPFFLSILIFLEAKSILFKFIYFTISLILFFLYLSLFTRGYFVA